MYEHFLCLQATTKYHVGIQNIQTLHAPVICIYAVTDCEKNLYCLSYYVGKKAT